MFQSNDRAEMSFDRSQHEIEQLRFYCMDPEAEKATLKAQLDNLDRQLTYHRHHCKEQETIIKDLRSELCATEDENFILRNALDAQSTSVRPLRDSPVYVPEEAHTANTQSSTNYHPPTVESVSDEEAGDTMPSVQQQDTTNRVLEVFLTFVSVTDSRMNERQTVYIRQQQPLRDVLGARVLGRFLTDAMAFVYKAQQICNLGQTAAEVSALPTNISSGRVS